MVLFSDETTGTVIFSEGEGLPKFGSHSAEWVPDDFEDVDETLIIWLTEGPHEPIYEAIETIDKIRTLRQTTP